MTLPRAPIPILLSFAVLTAMFAFGAGAQDRQAPHQPADAHAVEPPKVDEGAQDNHAGDGDAAADDDANADSLAGTPNATAADAETRAPEPAHEGEGHQASAAQADDANPAGHESPGAHSDPDPQTGDGTDHGDGAEGNHAVAGQEGAADEPPVGVAASGEAASAGIGMGDDKEALAPYRLVRSLQFIQDSVVMGDHSAMEMQRYLLGLVDSRLRQADQQVFDDPRNVDAALIYAMSGGNPETLEILAVKDKFGNFDNEITTVLRAYLNGQGAMNKETLAKVVKVYRDTEIGPYISLVAANVAVATNQNAPRALKLFDWARLTSPGTLVEEAALRRSLFISARFNLVDDALKYAQLYARRFINSPYAGQYADLLVDLVVGNYEKVGEERLNAILTFMDRPRKREVYLRIARKAVITGLRDLAIFASEKADALSTGEDATPEALAELYSGMARIPTEGVDEVLEAINALPARRLSRRDRALREAARIVAAEVLRKPEADSFTQATSPIVESQDGSGNDAAMPAVEAAADPAVSRSGWPSTAETSETSAEEEAFQGFVSDRKQALDRIDELLEGIEGEGGQGS